MTKAVVAKAREEDAAGFPASVKSADLDGTDRAGILQRARDRLIELRFKCAIDLADPARRGNTDLPIEELAKVQNAIDAIDKAIADDRGRGSKNPARPS